MFVVSEGAIIMWLYVVCNIMARNITSLFPWSKSPRAVHEIIVQLAMSYIRNNGSWGSRQNVSHNPDNLITIWRVHATPIFILLSFRVTF